MSASWQWKETAWTLEEPKCPLYCVAFNFFYRDKGAQVFASAGSNRATVYRCPPDGGLEVLSTFVDKDPDEEYFVCKWSLDMSNGNPLLLLAGKNGLLQVIDCINGVLQTTFEGHGMCINDIAVNPTRPWLVATASKDQAVRVWNLKSRVCVLVLQGDGAHRNEVLTLDWAPGGKDQIISAGMDSAIKIWSLEAFQETITSSDNWTPTTRAFPTRQVAFPMFSTRGVHWNYVDCVRFLGDFVLSKSVDNKIICWKRTPEIPQRPGVLPRRQPEGAIALVQELQLEDAKSIWWLRFSLNRTCSVLAVGTAIGRVLVFDPHSPQSTPMARLKPRRANGVLDGRLLVRQTAVSDDGSIIVSCHEDGSITRYDRVDKVNGGHIQGHGHIHNDEEDEDEEVDDKGEEDGSNKQHQHQERTKLVATNGVVSKRDPRLAAIQQDDNAISNDSKNSIRGDSDGNDKKGEGSDISRRGPSNEEIEIKEEEQEVEDREEESNVSVIDLVSDAEMEEAVK